MNRPSWLSQSRVITTLSTHLQVCVERDNGRRRKGETQKVGEREPEPELAEDQHADDGRHVHVARLGLQGKGQVSAACRKKRG